MENTNLSMRGSSPVDVPLAGLATHFNLTWLIDGPPVTQLGISGMVR